MSDPKNPSLARTWLLRVVVAAGGLALLYLITAFTLSRFLNPEELADWLEPRLEAAAGREVEVERVEVGFLPLGVRLEGVTVADPTGLAPSLARVSSVTLRVRLLPLIRREIQVNRLVVEEPQADLRVSEDGTSNFGDLSTQPSDQSMQGSDQSTPASDRASAGEEQPQTPEGESRSPFTLDLRGIRITGGSLSFSDGSGAEPMEAGLADLEVRAAVRGSQNVGWTLDGSGDAALSVRHGSGPGVLENVPLAMVFDLATDAELQSLDVRAGEVALDDVSLSLTGNISGLKDPVRRVSLALNSGGLPLEDLVALLPDSLRRRMPVQAQGSVAVDLTVAGNLGPGATPELRGTVGLTRGRLAVDGAAVGENITADLEVHPDRSIGARGEGTVLGGPFEVDGVVTLARESSPSFDLTLRGSPELEGVGSIVNLPEGVQLQGRLVPAVRVVGPVGRLSALRFSGNVRVESLQATHPSLGVPVSVPEGNLELSGVGVGADRITLRLGQDEVTLSGRVDDVMAFLAPEETPRFQGSVAGPRLDLRRLSSRPLPDSSLTYGKVAFAKVGGREVGGRSVQDAAEALGLTRPDPLPLAGNLTVQLDTVVDRTGRMENVRARIEFGPDFVRVSEATFRRYGGELQTSADLTLSDDALAPFSVSLRVQDLDASAFLAQTTPLGRFARGRLSVQLDLVGSLDSFLLPERPALMGSGGFALTGGGLQSTALTRQIADFLGIEALREPSVQDWTTSFVLEEGRIQLSQGTLQGAPGSPTVGGSVGLDGALDLRSAFALPWDRLNTSALQRLGIAGEIASNVVQRPDVVQAILRISGSVMNPAIQADPTSAARTLGQAVEEEVRREAQEQIEAGEAQVRQRIEEQKEALRNRATGFFQNLIRRQDTVTVPPLPDTAGVPVRDTTMADTVRPDTALPDTVRPDTLRPDTVQPDTVQPDTVQPDTIPPDTIPPDTIPPDTIPPDTIPPDTIPPDTLRASRASPVAEARSYRSPARNRR